MHRPTHFRFPHKTFVELMLAWDIIEGMEAERQERGRSSASAEDHSPTKASLGPLRDETLIARASLRTSQPYVELKWLFLSGFLGRLVLASREKSAVHDFWMERLRLRINAAPCFNPANWRSGWPRARSFALESCIAHILAATDGGT